MILKFLIPGIENTCLSSRQLAKKDPSLHIAPCAMRHAECPHLPVFPTPSRKAQSKRQQRGQMSSLCSEWSVQWPQLGTRLMALAPPPPAPWPQPHLAGVSSAGPAIARMPDPLSPCPGRCAEHLGKVFPSSPCTFLVLGPKALATTYFLLS